MTNEVFWGLTLERLELLAVRYREQLKREDRRAGEVVAILFNVNRDPKKSEGIDWQDVFPEWKQSGKVQTDDEMYGTMMGWTMMTKHLPSDGGVVPST